MRLSVALLLPLLALSIATAQAESEVYGGAGIGYSTFKLDNVDFEDSTLATRAFAGFRYGRYVALEAGYIDFGTAKDQVVLQFGQPSTTGKIKTDGYDLTLVGRYPFNDELVAFGRIGMLRWDSRKEVEGLPIVGRDDGNDLIWGLGVDFRGTQRIHLRIEAEFVDIEFARSWWLLTTSVMYGFPIGR